MSFQNFVDAINEGDIEKLEASLDPVYINDKIGNGNSMGLTPLVKSILKGNIDIVKFLLDHGADPNIQVHGMSPLLYSAALPEVAQLLLDYGADPNLKNRYGKTPLMIASERGNIPFINLLLDAHADLDLRDESGKTALISATENNKLEVVDLLLSVGANVNIKDNAGMTPLMIASAANNLRLIKLLFKYDGDHLNINERNNNNDTALLLASNYQVIEYLLNHKNVDVNIRDNFGLTPLFKSIKSKNEDTAKLLLNPERGGADINATDVHGNTPIMLALYADMNNLVKFILTSNLNPDLSYRNKDNKTVFDIAREKKDFEIMALLDYYYFVEPFFRKYEGIELSVSKNKRELLRRYLEKWSHFCSNLDAEIHPKYVKEVGRLIGIKYSSTEDVCYEIRNLLIDELES